MTGLPFKQAGALIAAAIALCWAGPGHAADRLNPTGRDIVLEVPLRLDGQYAGDVEITVTAEDTILADTKQLAALIGPSLTDEVSVQIFGRRAEAEAQAEQGITTVAKTQPGHETAPPLTQLLFGGEKREGRPEASAPQPVPTPLPDIAGLGLLRERGLSIRYDEASGELHAELGIDQRPARGLSFGAKPAAPPATTVKPAEISAYLNMRAALSHVAQSAYAETGLRAPTFDFEGATRISGVVLETEASVEGYEAGPIGQGDAPYRFRRKGSRLVYDDPENVVRFRAGDIYPGFTGFQTSPDILGFSAERTYARLRPEAGIRATGRTSFRLERAANVEILVDGMPVREIRLAPGNYDITDLPLRSGVNQVKLVIREDAGAARTLDFTLVSSHTLLAPGVDEWDFAAGVRARAGVNRQRQDSALDYSEPDYDFGQPVGTMFYRLGVTPFVTVEAYGQAARDLAMAGAGFLSETVLGLCAVNLAASLAETKGGGFALGADCDIVLGRHAGGQGSMWRLSAEYLSAGFRSLGDDGAGSREGLSLAAAFTESLGQATSVTLAGSLRTATGDDNDSFAIDLSLTRQLWDGVSAALTAGYAERTFSGGDCDCDFFDDSGFRALLRLSYRPDPRSFVTLSYDAGQKEASASWSRSAGSGAGVWHVSADAAYDHGEKLSEGGLTATWFGNRAEISASHSARVEGIALADGGFQPLSTDQRTTLRLESALAFADGQWALGRPVTGGFAIVSAHEALGDADVALRSGKSEAARSDGLGPALISDLPAYAPRSYSFDVEDLPLGHDLGEDEARFMAPYKAGHKVTVGNAYHITAIGTLLDGEGNPLQLAAGTAIEDREAGRSVELFTNRAGRFGAQGLAPGRWRIEIPGEAGPLTYQLDIPAEAEALFRAGTLRPVS